MHTKKSFTNKNVGQQLTFLPHHKYFCVNWNDYQIYENCFNDFSINPTKSLLFMSRTTLKLFSIFRELFKSNLFRSITQEFSPHMIHSYDLYRHVSLIFSLTMNLWSCKTIVKQCFVIFSLLLAAVGSWHHIIKQK